VSGATGKQSDAMVLGVGQQLGEAQRQASGTEEQGVGCGVKLWAWTRGALVTTTVALR
jgi:hypothetical protein